MTDSIETLKLVQARLNALGFNAGEVDGIMGKKTEGAISAFKKSRGLNPRPYLGPITMELLFKSAPLDRTPPVGAALPTLPWMNEISKYMGVHETNNFKKLWDWLRSDKSSVGDPRALPWCGDAVETAFKLSLPSEPFPGVLGKNPYLARNWLHFGRDDGPRYGSVGVFWRGSRTGLSGHVCFLIGFDAQRQRFRCRGGNQDNRISDIWLDANRLLGARSPSTWNQELPPLPSMNSSGAVVSTNEA